MSESSPAEDWLGLGKCEQLRGGIVVTEIVHEHLQLTDHTPLRRNKGHRYRPGLSLFSENWLWVI